MGNLRRFIKKVILEVMNEQPEKWYYARDLVNIVSEKIGKKISAYSITQYLNYFNGKNLIIKEKVNNREPHI